MHALLTAVIPVTQSISCVALLQKQLAIHRKKSEFIDLVAVAELSVVVGVGSAAIVETVALVETVTEALRPSVAESERVTDTL